MMKMTKDQVYNRLTEELIQSPEKLEKFMDAYGTMGTWFIFHHVKENNTKLNDLEKKFYTLKRQLEDLTTENTKLKSRVKSLSGKLEKSNKPLLER